MSSPLQPRLVALQRVGAEGLDAVMAVMNGAFDPRFGEAWTRSQCAGILPMTGVALTLAGTADDPLGFSLARTVAGESELLLLAVSPTVRGRGIGASLVRRFVEDGRAAAAHRLHLEVRDGNPAVALYERCGFRVAGRRRDYYRGDGRETFDALTMARTS